MNRYTTRRVTRAEACAAFGKAHRIGKCGYCNKLYVWPRTARIELNSPAHESPCCARPLYLTTWGRRLAVVVTSGAGCLGVLIDQAYQTKAVQS